MRHSNSAFATPEAQEARLKLKEIVRETRDTIARLATQGAAQLNHLSADEFHPMDLPVGMHLDKRPFRERHIVRDVTPKLFADIALDGFPGLKVIGAGTEHYERRHYYGDFIKSFISPGAPTYMTLPRSRSAETVSLHIVTDQTLEEALQHPRRRKPEGDFEPGITNSGRAKHGNAGYPYDPEPRLPMRDPRDPNRFSYVTAEEVKTSYTRAYPEALATAGLVAHGLQSFGIDLDVGNASTLFNDWQQLKGEGEQRATASEPIWAQSSAPFLQQHRQ